MLVYGLLSLQPTSFNGGQMIFRTSSVRGFWMATWLEKAAPETRQAAVTAVLMHMAKGDIVPPVEARYDLADIGNAVQHAERPGCRGKVLLASP